MSELLEQLEQLEDKLEDNLLAEEADWTVCLQLIEQRQQLHQQLAGQQDVDEQALKDAFQRSLRNNEKLLSAAQQEKPELEEKLITLAQSKRAHKLYE